MLKQVGGITYASSLLLESLGFITHAFLSRIGGISSPPFNSLNFDIRNGDTPANKEHNKKIAGRRFSFDPAMFLTVNQVHGNDVLLIDKAAVNISELSSTSADAVITNQCNIAIGILTADCVPIFLIDPVQRIIGVVHAGWKGMAKGVIKKSIETMVKQFGSDKKAMLSAVGPSIGPCCYMVDNAVVKEFDLRNSKSGGDEFIRKEAGCWRLDLKKAALVQMLNIGLLERNISIENLCTSCRNDIFFSYRKDNKITGRQLNFVIMRNKHLPPSGGTL